MRGTNLSAQRTVALTSSPYITDRLSPRCHLPTVDNCGRPLRDDQPDAREGQAGHCRVAERLVVPGRQGNAGGGKSCPRAGDLHVRFDERDVETGLRPGYWRTAKRKGRQQTNRTYCYRATSRQRVDSDHEIDAAFHEIDGSPPCRTSARSPTHPQQISVRDQLAFLISKRLSSGRRAGWLAPLELGGGACVLPRVGPRGLGFRLQAFSF